MKFYRRHWYDVGCILFLALAFSAGYWGQKVSHIQAILIYSFMALPVFWKHGLSEASLIFRCTQSEAWALLYPSVNRRGVASGAHLLSMEYADPERRFGALSAHNLAKFLT
jgi:hypothetical protein